MICLTEMLVVCPDDVPPRVSLDEAIELAKRYSDDAGKNVPVVKVKFSMNYPVEDSIYEYLTSNKNIVTNTSEAEVKISTITENAHPFRILPIDEINPYVNCVPLYDIKVAAGDFSELQNNSETEWIELPKSYKYSRDYFVCKINV